MTATLPSTAARPAARPLLRVLLAVILGALALPALAAHGLLGWLASLLVPMAWDGQGNACGAQATLGVALLAGQALGLGVSAWLLRRSAAKAVLALWVTWGVGVGAFLLAAAAFQGQGLHCERDLGGVVGLVPF